MTIQLICSAPHDFSVLGREQFLNKQQRNLVQEINIENFQVTLIKSC